VLFAHISANSMNLSAALTLSPSPDFTAGLSDTYVIVNNTGTGPVSGMFGNAAEGGTITLPDSTRLSISYQGGDGNDVVLTYFKLIFRGN
jgi:hypothetical protein